jgi:hypothetical protein
MWRRKKRLNTRSRTQIERGMDWPSHGGARKPAAVGANEHD